MRILISNDDGINAHGLKVLEKIARTISGDIWIVAPEAEQSGAGHSVTLHQPLRIRAVSQQKYAVLGTPTDCVLTAITHLMKDTPPDLVLSGINHGGNIAEDVTYSGTIAAAIEAIFLGVPAIAFSLVMSRPHPLKWATAEQYGEIVLKKLSPHMKTIPSNVLLNVNFPDTIASSVKGIKMTTQGHRKIQDSIVERIDPRGHSYFWLGPGDYRYENSGLAPSGTDLDATMTGYVSVTPLSLDLTHIPTLRSLEGVFSE